ncbi:MAG TPA: NAD(P)-binding domain-containing protein [Nocardioidaceae bacterium]|nr:NAD(P)-binding domain-containing protein [Nocardioidaceae bacterium]
MRTHDLDDHRPRREVERIDTVVIGGGQAGLAAGYHLARRDRSFVIVDACRHTGDSWRCHWDSLRLYSPARLDGLPGMDFPASGSSYPTKDEVADFLEAYTKTFNLPVRTGTRVSRLAKSGDGYVVECNRTLFEARNVIVATGTFGRVPRVPASSARIDPRVVQLHSSEYRNLDQLQSGPVLVVGASHSGGDIALEAARTHPTILCGRDTGQLPVRLEAGYMRLLFPLMWQFWGHALSVRTPMGRKMRAKARFHGAPMIRVKGVDLDAAGVERVTERVTAARDGSPVVGAYGPVDVANIIWCTGFRHDFSWIDAPVIGDDGWPRESHGVVSESPGLYFTGLAFQSSFRSMLIGGVGADAEHVVRHIATHREPGDLGSPTHQPQ